MRGPDARPSVPPGRRVYGIGDLHGRSDLLIEKSARIVDDLARRPVEKALLVFVGDYVDRGPDSSGVVNELIALSQRLRIVCLKGNHEQLLIKFLARPETLGQWMRLGAAPTLMSYGLRPTLNPTPHESAALAADLHAAMPFQHQEFLTRLKTSFAVGGYFFAHAGVRPGFPLNDQDEDDLLWIREEFLFHDGDFGKVVVHGHTPVPAPEVLPNRINIDTGAYATGKLACLVLEGDSVEFI